MQIYYLEFNAHSETQINNEPVHFQLEKSVVVGGDPLKPIILSTLLTPTARNTANKNRMNQFEKRNQFPA
jgi:hypothetical protein